jgi:putative transposase
MPRRARSIAGGLVYHVLNRSNGRIPLFRKASGYEAFLKVLDEAQRRLPLRILAYCLMNNHWHFLVWPEERQGKDVSEFFRWLTVTHTQRWHAHYGTSGSGHLYQGRFKSFPIQGDDHFYTVARYVERNALRAGLVQRAEDWQFGSLWRHYRSQPQQPALLSSWPLARPAAWIDWVNEPQTEAEVEAVRKSIQRSRPFGGPRWPAKQAKELGLEWTVRPRGRPKKQGRS